MPANHAVYHGHQVLFLHQVDDLAITTHDPVIPAKIIQLIDSKSKYLCQASQSYQPF